MSYQLIDGVCCQRSFESDFRGQWAYLRQSQVVRCTAHERRDRSGCLFLAAVLDLHSRNIVGWAMAPEMPATLVCTALQMAMVQRNPAAGR